LRIATTIACDKRSDCAVMQPDMSKVPPMMQDMHKDLMRLITDLRTRMVMSEEGLMRRGNEIETLNAQVQTIQEEVAKTNSRLSALRVDVQTNSTNMGALQELSEHSSTGLSRLIEGQKFTNAGLHSLKSDYTETKESLHKLAKEVAGLGREQTTSLLARLDQLSTVAQHLNLELETNKLSTRRNEEACKDLHNKLEDAWKHIEKNQQVRKAHEDQISELKCKADKVKDNLEMTNGVVMKLHNEHEETRLKTINVQNSAHELDTALRRLADYHTDTVQKVSGVRTEIGKMSAAHGSLKDKMMQTADRINGLNDGLASLQHHTRELGKNVEMVHSLACNTEETLHMTKALVLPNVESDAFSPRGMQSTSLKMSSVDESFMSSGASARSTPRSRGKTSSKKMKEATWFARNIGSVPDRNSWI